MKWIKLSLMLVLVGVAGVAYAADGGASDPYTMYYPIIATAIGALGAVVRKNTLESGFWHTWYGHAALVLIGSICASLVPVFEAGTVNRAAIISALVGGGAAFLSAIKANGVQSAPATALLPLLLLPLLASSGCAGFKAPSYAVLTTMAVGAGATAEQLPAICESQENAAVDSSTSKDDAITKAGAIHARCKTTLAILKGTGEGLTSARDAIHDAPTGADLSAVMPWLRLAVKQYCDMAPLLASFPALKAKLPTIPGVC